MFKRSTLFILGAGSSAEVGLPFGTELAATIGKKMDIRFDFGMQQIGIGDADLFQNVTHRNRQEANAYQQAGWLIRDGIGLAQSIDDFLDLHRNNPRVNRYGKAAIVKSILEAEKKSKLYVERDGLRVAFDTEKIADTWFVKFMRMLGRGLAKEDVRHIFDNISFIVFNYDRCLEYFLSTALQRLYSISEREVSEIVANLNIIHPYGVVGNVPFGSDRANYFDLAGGIKTYTEQVEIADMTDRLSGEVERAECIVFLGFAYHNQNMSMLKPPTAMRHKFVFGTAYQMSDADVDVVTHQIASFFTPTMDQRARTARIKLENKLKSADLFDYYAKSLTGGD
jgi:hypothetical protein